MDNLLHGLSGGYVPPGPSGVPTRGSASVLPTGRNFFGIDPESVPTPVAWNIGVRMADIMLKRYFEEKGEYPSEIAVVIWATDTMKTNGDDVAYILWLMGVKPVWSKSTGKVSGLSVIPLSELGRPRIDVTIRITGLFRDAYPNLIDMFNDAVDLVADLDESDEENRIRANIRAEIVENIASGLSEENARRDASIRVFGSPPGSYGAGIDLIIGTGEWDTRKDLADIYESWSSFAYGRGMYGVQKRKQFARRLSRVTATVKNMPDREHDILHMDEVFNYLGGMNAYVKQYGRQDAIYLIGDNSDPNRLGVRDVAEECRFIFRSAVLNPKYIEGLKRHGFRGAQEIAKIAEYMIGWDSTSDGIDDWMYEALAEKFILSDDKWVEEANPFAAANVIKRLFEAIDRKLWDADDEMKQRLREAYVSLEGLIEERMDWS